MAKSMKSSGASATRRWVRARVSSSRSRVEVAARSGKSWMRARPRGIGVGRRCDQEEEGWPAHCCRRELAAIHEALIASDRSSAARSERQPRAMRRDSSSRS